MSALVEGVRLTLRPYQSEALERTLAARDRGVLRQMGVAATGLGKQQPLDEPVLTPGGWVEMGDLRPGDHVIGGDGKPVEVLSVHPQGLQPVVRVTFRDGSWTRCGPEHLWATRSKHDVHRERPWRVLPTNDLKPGWHLPVVAPCHLEPVPLPLDPYVLGVLLGDGSLGRPHLRVSTDRWVAERCGWLGLAPHATSAYTCEGAIRDPAVAAVLRSLGLWGKRSWEKHVPPIYMLGHPDERLALLRGLMDTDGSPMADGGAEFSSTSETLVLAVAELVRSLGGVARNVTRRLTDYMYRGERRQGRPSWRVNVKLAAGWSPFSLPRKAGRWVQPTKYPPARIIASVDPDGPPVEQACIRVANADGLYVTRSYVVTHNTVIFCALAERMATRTLVLAHRDELIEQAAAKVREVWPAARVGVVKAERNEVGADVVVASVQTLARGARLDRLVRTQESALLGDRPFGLVVVDEAHHSAAPTYVRIMEALRCGAPDGPLLLGVTATPDRGDGRGLDHLFDEVTWSYDVLWGIRSGYLADVKGKRVHLDALDLGEVRVSRGDYDQGQAGAALRDAGAPAAIVRAWTTFAPGRRTLVFTPTVELARLTQEAFSEVGIAAGMVSGETPLDERRATLRAFSEGRVDVLANCFDSETELLTERGWVGIDEIAEGDRTAAVDPTTGAARWEAAERIVRRPRADGERMVHLVNQTIDVRVTEGHRMLWRTRGAAEWQITEATELPTKRASYQLRVAARGTFAGVPLTAEELQFLGLFATDGTLNRERAALEITQAAASPVCAEIERILSACGFDWKVTEGTARTPAGGPSPYKRYRVPKGNIGGQLKRAGWGRLRSWINKSLSPALSDMTRDQFRHLLYGLWLGDGIKSGQRRRRNSGITVCGADRTLLDRLQAWAVLRGMAASQSWRPNTGGGVLGYVTVRDRDIVTTNNASVPTSGGNPARFENDDRCEEVWCVTNQTGTVIARRRGRVVVAGQCAVLTEGYDEPRVDCIVVARPTRSRALYAQMVGRGTRRHPDKDHLLVLDVVGATAEHSLVTIPTLFGIENPEEWEASERAVTVQLDEQEAEAVRLGRLRAEDVEMFRQVRSEGLAWVAVHDPGQARWYTISLGGQTRRRVLLREMDGAGTWVATAEREVPDPDGGRATTERKVLIADVPMEMAQGVAEDYVRKVGPSALTAADAPWRKRSPSSKAKAAAKKWRLPNVDRYKTAGELSDALEAHIARVRTRRRPMS